MLSLRTLIGTTLAAAFLFSGATVRAGEPSKRPAPKAAAKEKKMSDKPHVVIETNKGIIEMELYPDQAPKTVAQFVSLVKEGFYDGLDFHRYEPNFVIQGGDPERKGKKDAPTIVGEFESNGHANTLSHKKGAVGLARTDVKDSGSSQFYICTGDAQFLDKNYCAFGMVVSGRDVADSLRAKDEIKKATVKE